MILFNQYITLFFGSPCNNPKNTEVIQVGITGNSIPSGKNKEKQPVQGDAVSPSVLALEKEGNLLL